MDLTDEQINRRVAEIEGWEFDPNPPCAWVKRENGEAVNFYPGEAAPPFISDWAWCGAFWEGRSVAILRDSKMYCVTIFDNNNGHAAADESLTRAICLAVIAAEWKE